MSTTFDAPRQLEGLRAMLAARRRCLYANRARLAPDFNALQFLRTDEYGLSVIIMDLLDPQGTHGQGAAFLELFTASHLADCGLDAERLKLARLRLEEPTRHVETSRRRIDISLRIEGFVLGIESKLKGAQDQKSQVEDYLGHLARECEHYRLIYLTRDGSTPTHQSISAHSCTAALSAEEGTRPRLQCMGAADLAAWVKQCAHACEAERVRAFLSDFHDYIHTELLGERGMGERESVVDWATCSQEHMAAAIAVINAGEAIRDRLFEKLECAVKKKLAQSPELQPWSFGADGRTSVPPYQLWVRPTDHARYGIRCSLKEGFVGICRHEDVPHEGELEDVAKAIQWNGNPPTVRWPLIKDFATNGLLINEVLALTLDESENGLVARIVKEFNEIAQLLRDKGLLDRLSIPASSWGVGTRG